MNKEIGGYFGLELNMQYDYFTDGIGLNCARNCLRYIIRVYNIKEIYVPFYTCPVVWQAIKKEHCNIKFYHIDKYFMPVEEFPDDAYILYTNYFGICAKNVKILAGKYKNLVVDNAQAFYMPQYGIASFNSLRKFFGVPDGAILSCDKKLDEKFQIDESYDRALHLLKRIDVNAHFGYQDFCENENKLNDEPIKFISNLTKSIFNSIDVNKVKQKRLENFQFLSDALSKNNEMKIVLDENDVPLVYPYMTTKENLRKKLINNKIYVATYWNPQPETMPESLFQRYIIPLPIDQRYSKVDMQRILEVIDE